MKILTILPILFLCAFSFVDVRADESEITNRKIKFSVDSDSLGFGIHANADGVLNVKNKNITVNLSNISFKHNPEYKYTYKIISYDLCVAEMKRKDGPWDLHKCSHKTYPINSNISPGELAKLPDHSFRIRYVPKLEDKWLVLLIVGTAGTFYSHSEKEIFQIYKEP